MHNQLHDEIDQLEEFRGQARALVERVISENLAAALMEAGDDIGGAMAILAGLVEEELTDLTTTAFGAGVKFAKQRRAVG